MSSSSFDKFVLGALVGGVLGAIIGILTAPRSGRETRELLSSEVKGRYDESMDVLKRNVDESVDRVKHTYDRSVDRVQQELTQLKDKAESLSKELEQVGREAVQKLKPRKEDAPSAEKAKPVETAG
ncbi:MAG: YtxH domain-containing protein [Candidatus Melainabacteria bacterium]|nr:YtxH domain-containing protein [Candidatus Melainabacteria bacterium]